MGNEKMSGLTKRGGLWHIDKQFRGIRICESTGTSRLQEAIGTLAKRMDDIRKAQLYGLRAKRTFRAAATKFLDENQHKRSIDDDAWHLKLLDPFVGDLFLPDVHMDSLKGFVEKRRQDGVKTKTINLSLGIVRHILRLAELEWRDERGLSWLERAPKIKLISVKDARKPYPLSPEEEQFLLRELPEHLQRMALFKENTGCREAEVCNLRWAWEVQVPELRTSVFVIPGEKVKNTEDRLVVLNAVARSVIDRARGMHPTHVFVRKVDGEIKPLTKMYNTAWKSARERAADAWEAEHEGPAPKGFRCIRVHDLKHTFGRRLRSAGVSFEDRQDLLGHKSRRITTHYSQAELANLIAAAEKTCSKESRKSPATSWTLNRATTTEERKSLMQMG